MAATDPAGALAVTPEQVVARERPLRTRLGFAALAAAALTVVSNLVQNLALADGPKVNEIDALRDAAGQPLGRPGLATDAVLYLHDHTAALLAAIVLQALVYLAMGAVLLQLLRMTLDRGGRAPRPTRFLVLFGSTVAALGGLVRIGGLVANASDFASSSDQSTQAAH